MASSLVQNTLCGANSASDFTAVVACAAGDFAATVSTADSVLLPVGLVVVSPSLAIATEVVVSPLAAVAVVMSEVAIEVVEARCCSSRCLKDREPLYVAIDKI